LTGDIDLKKLILWLGDKDNYKGVTGLLLLLFSGLTIGFCVTFPTVPGLILEWLALVPACLYIFKLTETNRDEMQKHPVRRILKLWGTGFLFFMSEYLVIYHWFISMYPLEFTGISKAGALCVVLLGWIGLSILGSLGGATVFLLIVLLTSGKLAKRHGILKPLTIAVLYPVFEWIETKFWTGVPWNRLGLGQLCGNFTLTVLSSSLLGPYFTTFLIVFVSALVAYAVYTRRFKRYLLVAASVFLANIICGLSVIVFSTAGDPVTVSAVQGNYSSSEKWSASVSETMETYKELTRKAAAAGAETVIWPETAITSTVSDGTATDKTLSSLAEECNIMLCVGIFENIKGELCNVIRVYLPDGSVLSDSYSKRHLVPFGEYVPERKLIETLFPPLVEIGLLDRDLGEGTASSVKVYNRTAYGWLICFDSIYETLSTTSVSDGAEIILMSTNDSWFGTSRALYMHTAQARLRAIENLTPVVRAANTGISACIDRLGRVVVSSEPLVEDVLTATLETSGSGSLYSIMGNLFIFLCGVYISALSGHELGYKLGALRKRKR